MMNKAKEFGLFLKELYEKKGLVFGLAKNDFKAKNAGSFLGILWSFIIPVVSMLVFWFVFTVLKSPPRADVPFMAWFLPAYVPWMFFTEVSQNAANVLYEFHYLVKKVKFRTALLPLVKVMSGLMVNLFFIVFMFVVLTVYKVPLTPYALQIFYYMTGLIIFCTGLSWVLSSIAVFFRDLTSIVNIVVQLGFWLTPIMWALDDMPAWIGVIARLNPMYYISNGFRMSFIPDGEGVLHGFWEMPTQTVYFWCLTAVVFIGGAMLFRKLRPHFADVL